MESLYCGGRFCFDYLDEGYEKKAAEDYRAALLGDVRLLLRSEETVRLSDRITYIGPFYFETAGMIDQDIVQKEMGQIEDCSWAIFLLDDCQCPGTIGELIYAATLGKRISIYYIQDERETESKLHSSCWYPIILCQKLNGDRVETFSCADYEEAKQKILTQVKH